MRMPNICIIMNTISDLSDNSGLKRACGIGELRRNASILIIDDNAFYAEDFLKINGFNIHHKNDIESIQDVQPYDIVLCDIAGVGKTLGFSKEGAFIIREIHANYPNKRVIAYTSYTYDADYNEFFSLADFVAPKDLSIDAWIDVLDEQIKKSIDPVEQWRKIRNCLLEQNVSTLTVAKIEDKFVSSVKNNNFNSLEKYINSEGNVVRTIINDFVSSLCAKLILGAISGGN